MPLDPADTSVRALFAGNLRRLRIENGFRSARAFARRVGIDDNRYTRYERAEVEPNLNVLLKICDTLQVSPNELLMPPMLGTQVRNSSP